MLYKYSNRKFRNSIMKCSVIIVTTSLIITMSASSVTNRMNEQTIDESSTNKDETGTKNTASEGSTAEGSTGETITTFSDGSSSKKFVFGNMSPVNGTTELKIPKDANVTKALMDVTGLTHNLCLNASGENINDNFGISVSTAGDVNNDGYDDVIVGAPSWNEKGRVYIYYGNEFGISATPHTIDGENIGDNFGASVSYAGDVNNDSYADIIVGAPNCEDKGKIYVFHGSSNGIVAALAIEANSTATGDTIGETFGASVSTAGDMNNDGYDDVIIGAPLYDIPPPKNYADAGRFYIFHGSSVGIDNTSFNKIPGKNDGDHFGNSVSYAGDVNNDGSCEIIVGAYLWEANDKGKVYIYNSSTIKSGNPVTIRGEDYYDYFGCSVSYAGDMNNDGFDDVIVGADGCDQAGGDDFGRAYIFHGSSSGIQANEAFQANTIINGTYEGEAFGHSVSYAGNVNKDDYDDVIIGAYHYESNFGMIYIYHGSASGTLEYWATSILGEDEGGYFGVNVSYAGDINNDGYADVIVGEYGFKSGRMYIYTGSLSGISNMPASTFKGPDIGDTVGHSVSSAGDVNNDGYDDLVIGNPSSNVYGIESGRVYVFLGTPSGISSTPTTIIHGKGKEYFFGYSVSSGDVNNDGYADLVIGAPGNGTAGKNSGTVYIFYGGPNGIIASTADDANVRIDGNNDDGGPNDQGDGLGTSVSCAGDINNDGYDDIIVGAPYYRVKDTGRVYIFHGSSTGIVSGYANTVAHTYIDGENDRDGFGYSVSSAGHVDNDVHSDIIISAPWVDLNASDRDAGKVYIYYGSSSGIIKSTFNYLMGNSWDQFGKSVSNAGNVNNDGYDDIIVGAPFFDAGGTDTGRVYIYHGTSSGIPNNATPSATIDGESITGNFGKSVSYAGDINNDGYDDVIAGADYADVRGSQSGEMDLFHGSNAGILAASVSEANLTLKGEKTNDGMGWSVSCAGDVNNDGYADIIVGAKWYSCFGKIYVLYGGPKGILWWYSDFLPYNPRIDVGANGTIDWNYTGYYNGTETMNFTSELRDYLAGHQNESIDGYIYVPINVTCDSRGTIMLDNLNIECISLTVGAPTNVSAVLEGIDLRDMNITWTLSKDDSSGKNNVNNYAIYRNMSYNSSGTGYAFLAEVPKGIAYYVDTGAGDVDPNNYFYYIQANVSSENTAKNDTQVAKFIRLLSSGRQLVSFPLNLSNNDITVVLQTIEGSYNYVQWYDPLDANDHWRTYVPSKPEGYNDLFTADHKMALWITMTLDDNLTVAGIVPMNTTIQLYKGWNFVGYPSFTNRNVGDVLNDIPYEQVEGFDETASPYYLKILADTDIMKAGYGYWIRVSEDCTWTVDFEYISLTVGAPTNVSAVLEGIGFQDVNITWILSIDDGTGKNNVNNYTIYRSMNYNSSGTGYIFLAEVPKGTAYYVDAGAGDGDPNNYFYYVQAKSTSGKVNKSEEQAGKFVRILSKGRQLFSIPLNQSDTNITKVLQTIEGNYNYVQWYNSTDAIDHWKTYSINKPSGFNDLLNIDHKIALWINMTSPDNLTVAGIVPKSTTIQLYKGWNFVSYASFINRTVENALSGISYDQVEGFDGDASPYYLKTFSNSDIMTAGYGYWIKIAEDCTWIIEN